jgi:hypothetical protein
MVKIYEEKWDHYERARAPAARLRLLLWPDHGACGHRWYAGTMEAEAAEQLLLEACRLLKAVGQEIRRMP